jgi:peptide subunit release factor 1 (eRF1)
VRRIEVPARRLARWLDGFAERHGETSYDARDGAVVLTGTDGTSARVVPPYPPLADATRAGLLAHATRARSVGLVLLRRGGYAVGVADAGRLTASKVGTRYVQGRTAAGGWSQQRFARRRDNQTAEIVGATAEHVVRLVLPAAARLDAVVTGGDRALLGRLMDDARLAPLRPLVVARVLDVPDPRQPVLEQAVERAGAWVVELED